MTDQSVSFFLFAYK